MMSDSVSINPTQTALVLIDLQKGVLGMPTAPYDTSTVIDNSRKLARKFRSQNGVVIFVHVGSKYGGQDMLSLPTDESLDGSERPDDWMEFSDDFAPQENDLIITKKQWGAFYGTDLDLQLRRRDIDTIVLGGIATNFGVESTARDAYERNYRQIFAEDAISGISEKAHRFAIETVFKRMGHVRSTEQIRENMH